MNRCAQRGRLAIAGSKFVLVVLLLLCAAPAFCQSCAMCYSTARAVFQEGQKAITQGLRKFFDSVAAEPVPSDFMDILKQIDGKKGDA